MWPTSEFPICPSGKPTFKPSVRSCAFGYFVYNADQKDLTNIDLHNIEKMAQDCVIDKFFNSSQAQHSPECSVCKIFIRVSSVKALYR